MTRSDGQIMYNTQSHQPPLFYLDDNDVHDEDFRSHDNGCDIKMR